MTNILIKEKTMASFLTYE